MISMKELLKGHCSWDEVPKLVDDNLIDLLSRINVVRGWWGLPMIVTSGYRTPKYNQKIGGSPNSAHMFGKAVDIYDPDQKLQGQLKTQDGRVLLTKLGLYCEHFDYTPIWVHFTTRPPKSGRRFFKP